MPNPYAQVFEQLRREYGAQLETMPLPEGLPEHLGELIAAGDQDSVTLMLKLAWQFGAQAGFAAGLAHASRGEPEAEPVLRA